VIDGVGRPSRVTVTGFRAVPIFWARFAAQRLGVCVGSTSRAAEVRSYKHTCTTRRAIGIVAA
jgi:hypothetical protein